MGGAAQEASAQTPPDDGVTQNRSSLRGLIILQPWDAGVGLWSRRAADLLQPEVGPPSAVVCTALRQSPPLPRPPAPSPSPLSVSV